MPQLLIPTTETSVNITRPVIYGIIKDLFDLTGIPVDTMISFPGELESMQQPGSDMGTMAQQSGVNTMSFNNRIFIEVDEDYEMDRILSTATYRSENPHIFRDDRIEVGIRPIYSSTETTINFKFRAVDKTEATRWRDLIRSRVSMNWDQRIHKVSYHYLVPMEFLIILKEIHRLMENVDGYGVELNDYIRSGMSNRATIMTTQAGTEPAWAIAESQVRIVGMFDFDLVPDKGSKEDEADTWTIAFAYKFRYDKPVACTMKYPLMIHNQLLPQNYRNNPLTDNTDKLADEQFEFTLSSYLFYQFEKDTENKRLRDRCITKGFIIPSFDEFIPDGVMPFSVNILTVLIGIDTTNPHLLLSLKDLGDYDLAPEVIDFMIGESQYMTKLGHSIFMINMYRGDTLLDTDSLTLDSDLNVYSTYILTLRKYYHIRLSVISDLSILNHAAIERMRNHGKATQIIFDYMFSSVHKSHGLPKILADDYITRDSMQDALRMLEPHIKRGVTGETKTVQTLVIKSRHLKER
jgi:hypothetical protein